MGPQSSVQLIWSHIINILEEIVKSCWLQIVVWLFYCFFFFFGILQARLPDFTLHSLWPFLHFDSSIPLPTLHFIINMYNGKTRNLWKQKAFWEPKWGLHPNYECWSAEESERPRCFPQSTMFVQCIINYSSSFLSREPKPRQKDKISYSTLSRPSTTIQWARLIEE